MKTWSFWDPARGEFSGRKFSADDATDLAANTPQGCIAVEGSFDWDTHRIDEQTGEVVAWRPPRPTEGHEWIGGAWKLSEAAQRRGTIEEMRSVEIDQARAVREALLELLPPGKGARLRMIDETIVALRNALPPPVE